MNLQTLAWDSDFFKIKIGKVILSDLKYKDIDGIFAKAKQSGFRLLYIESDRRLLSTLLRHNNLKLVDIKTTLQVKVKQMQPIKTNWNIVEYRGSRVTRELEQLAYESGIYSRFHIDPMFPDKLFKKLYKKWIQNSLHKKSADIVFVCLSKRMKPVGFVTVKQYKDTSHIGLISVAKQYRKKHIGFSLLQHAIQWSFMRKCKHMTITTQLNNISAMNLYQKCGFTIREKKYFYHYWI